MFNLCIVIPNYNHSRKLDALMTALSVYQLPCILVDDGSNQKTKDAIKSIQTRYQFIDVITLDTNQGKGAAVIKGFNLANKKGYSHALQIDADYQHDLADIDKFIQLAKAYPDDLISGKPIYDESVPKSRLYGRKITNFWVAIETLSLKLPEAMCGFRIYPLKSVLKLLEKTSLSNRMAFDIEIMVKLYWQGINIHFIPTKVTYPLDGSSHFHLLKDNLKISLMHTRLFFGMLYHLPSLVRRKF
ncbi:glycosyltransferase family 2 protein [Thiotrichales bacterium 19S11-10]|nr:glycosyltransferase family 2 protein [Thiotrichales bacterium 19S11-10]